MLLRGIIEWYLNWAWSNVLTRVACWSHFYISFLRAIYINNENFKWVLVSHEHIYINIFKFYLNLLIILYRWDYGSHWPTSQAYEIQERENWDDFEGAREWASWAVCWGGGVHLAVMDPSWWTVNQLSLPTRVIFFFSLPGWWFGNVGYILFYYTRNANSNKVILK